MREITIEQIDEIKHDSKAVLLIYAEGCAACESAKPYFESIESKYDQFYFYKLQFSEAILPFYNKHVPKQPAMVQVKTEAGDALSDESGKPILQFKLDNEGRQIMETPISFPNFFVFVNGFIDEQNEYGFVGNVAGFDPRHLEHALNYMSEQRVG